MVIDVLGQRSHRGEAEHIGARQIAADVLHDSIAASSELLIDLLLSRMGRHSFY